MKPFALLLLAAAGLLAADYAAEGKLWWSHIEFLASDNLQGRNVGSEGLEQAVKYVESTFAKLGLRPAGTSGYRQRVPFVTRELIPAESSLALVRGGQEEPLALGQDASLSSRAELAPSVEAPMVFVGYGMSVPEAHYDDLQGIDLRGKIAVYVNAAAPFDANGNVKSHYSSAVERWAALHRAGAIGFASLPNPRPNAPKCGCGRPWSERRRRATTTASERCSGRAETAGNAGAADRYHHHPPRSREVLRRDRPLL